MRAADRRRVIHQREDAGADGWLRPPLLFSSLFEILYPFHSPVPLCPARCVLLEFRFYDGQRGQTAASAC